MRHRITVHADNVELRGYIDTESNEELVEFSQNMAPVGVVIASAVEPDYDPFAPSVELSLSSIVGMIDREGIMDTEALVMHMASIHTMQARVIQGERRQKEEAQAELTKRELHHFETEQENERLKANLEQERAEHESTLHTGQAYMEENERLKADHTESEKALIDKVNEQADVIQAAYNALHMETRQAAMDILQKALEGAGQ